MARPLWAHVSQYVLTLWISEMCLQITHWKLLKYLPGTMPLDQLNHLNFQRNSGWRRFCWSKISTSLDTGVTLNWLLSYINQLYAVLSIQMCMSPVTFDYCQTSNIRCTLVGNKLVDHSDVVGAMLVGAAPTTCGSGHETVAVLLPGFAINW